MPFQPPKPCRDSIDRLVKSDPYGLLLWMDPTAPYCLTGGYLAYAAEVLPTANIPDDDVLRHLLPLLNHPLPAVREGVVLGLDEMRYNTRVVDALRERRAIENEPSVLAALDDVLEYVVSTVVAETDSETSP